MLTWEWRPRRGGVETAFPRQPSAPPTVPRTPLPRSTALLRTSALRLGARKHFTHIKSSFSSVFPISNHQIKGLRPLSTVVLLTHAHPGGTKAQLALELSPPGWRAEPSDACQSSHLDKLCIPRRAWQSTSPGADLLRKTSCSESSEHQPARGETHCRIQPPATPCGSPASETPSLNICLT